MIKYKATVNVNGDSELIKKVFASEDKQIKEKTSYTIKKTSSGVSFVVEAADSVGLRTALNSITKLLTVIEKIKNLENG
jgi:tRNA threonylcarbamoyladenosine modification (KEOPS) complex  Pcc1 subunit